MATTSTLSVKLARETMPMLQDIRRSYVLTHPTTSPTDSAAIGYAFHLVARFKQKGGAILWNVLMSRDFDFTRFNLPPVFPCEIRYVAAINRTLVPTLDNFIATELRPCFEGKVYRNFAIRAVLRAAYCLTHEGFKDVLIVAGTVPAAAPAAYDPYSLLFPNGTNSPAALGDTLDPDILERVERATDPVADAVFDETGVF